MSFEYVISKKCKKCGKIFNVHRDTLNFYDENFDKCPFCGEEGGKIGEYSIAQIIKNKKRKLDEMEDREF